MSVPQQKPTESRQDFETPRDFLDALEARWGKLDVDLACRTDNCKASAGYHLDKDINSLQQPWADEFPDGNCWLNPEFGNIEPFARKCAIEGPKFKKGKIFLLTPASIGTNWYAQYVYGRAMVIGLSPRITFVGASQGYPKDLSLSIFGPGIHGHGVWRWKGEAR